MIQVQDLPKNLEVERNILGSLLIDKKSLSLVINYLKEDIFYDYKHKLVFKTIREMYDKNIPIDITTLYQRIIDAKQIICLKKHLSLCIIDSIHSKPF